MCLFGTIHKTPTNIKRRVEIACDPATHRQLLWPWASTVFSGLSYLPKGTTCNQSYRRRHGCPHLWGHLQLRCLVPTQLRPHSLRSSPRRPSSARVATKEAGRRSQPSQPRRQRQARKTGVAGERWLGSPRRMSDAI